MTKSRAVPLIALVVLGLAACAATKKKVVTGNDDEQRRAASGARAPAARGDGEQKAARPGPLFGADTIYFDYDSSALRSEARDPLGRLAQHLQRHPDVALTITGHCDERGTTEYNLALGDRRARAAAEYLTRLGVADSRVKVVSYGKERPAVEGSSESVWAKNRRDEFELGSGGGDRGDQ